MKKDNLNLEEFQLKKSVANLKNSEMHNIKGTSAEIGEGGLTFKKYWTAGSGEVSQIAHWDIQTD